METFAYQSQYSIATQRYVDLCGFIGPMTQHQRHCNRTARMTHMPGGVGTFTYQSQYSLMTQPHAILHSFSFFEYRLNQFPGKIEMPVLLDENQIEFVFHSIPSANTSHFHHSTSAQISCKLKKRLTLYPDWNINRRIYICILNSHDVNRLIARILMKLQRYITRRHDFACYWRSLLLHGLLKSQHMFFWVLITLFRLLCILFIKLPIFLINLVTFMISHQPGYIFYKPVHISMYTYYKTAYISMYVSPKPVYMSVEVTYCDIKK